jgi:UPF0755 protein
MRKLIKFGILLVIIVILMNVYVAWQAGIPNENAFGEKEFVIEPGQGVGDITRNLVEQGFLSKEFLFKVYVWEEDLRSRFIDGEYILRTDMSIKNLVQALMLQNAADETSITLLEGWNVEEMDANLTEQGVIESKELINYSKKFRGAFALTESVGKDWELLAERPVKASLEGYLYPDTYRVYKQTSVEEIVSKMLDNFHAKADNELRAEMDKQGLDFFEVLTLASIVEGEMFGYENRRMVADVFLKRLEVGMALQSDATVNYITKKGTTRPSREDTRIDNPYNTYKYPGLPPGPINNPSIEAIRSVVYAKANPYWYFITTKESEIIYGRTLDEHNANVHKYLN